MADQANFDKPDGTSNYSNEVWETLRANVKAALAWLPGSRTNPGTGAVRRSTPSAGELLLETSNDATGSAWSTLFDSRTKARVSGETLTGSFVIWGPTGLKYEILNSSDSNRGGFISDTGSAFRISSNSGVRPVEIAPDGAVSTTFAVGGYVGIKESPSSNFYLSAANGGSSGIRVGLISIGASGAGYPVAGYNVRYTGSNDSYLYHVTDVAAFMSYAAGALNFYTAPSGSAGAAMTPVLAAKIPNNTSNFRLMGAAPKLEHETGGQVVGEIAFGTGAGRGTVSLTTRTTAGASAVNVFQAGGVVTEITNIPGTAKIVLFDGQINIGVGGLSPVNIFENAIVPGSDNAVLCGGNGFRWSAVWAANGTIQTSDLTDKTDIAAIDGARATALVRGLKPIMYRWLVGGQKVEAVEDGFDEKEIDVEEKYLEEIQEPVTEEVEVDHIEDHIEMVNGAALLKQVKSKRKERRPVGVYVPMVDQHGTPIMRQTGTRKRTVGRGLMKREVDEPIMEQAHHFVPTLRTLHVERTRTVKRMERTPRYKTITHQVPGKRLHAGFGAQDIKSLMDRLGIDCGLWVLDENGKQHMRPDQLIPFLAAALAHAIERIDRLERLEGGATITH